MEEKRFCLLLFGQNRYSCIGYSTTETFTIDGFYSCFYTFITHNIGILSHGTQQISVIDQTQDSIRLIKAYTDYVGILLHRLRRTESPEVRNQFLQMQNGNLLLS